MCFFHAICFCRGATFFFLERIFSCAFFIFYFFWGGYFSSGAICFGVILFSGATTSLRLVGPLGY